MRETLVVDLSPSPAPASPPPRSCPVENASPPQTLTYDEGICLSGSSDRDGSTPSPSASPSAEERERRNRDGYYFTAPAAPSCSCGKEKAGHPEQARSPSVDTDLIDSPRTAASHCADVDVTLLRMEPERFGSGERPQGANDAVAPVASLVPSTPPRGPCADSPRAEDGGCAQEEDLNGNFARLEKLWNGVRHSAARPEARHRGPMFDKDLSALPTSAAPKEGEREAAGCFTLSSTALLANRSGKESVMPRKPSGEAARGLHRSLSPAGGALYTPRVQRKVGTASNADTTQGITRTGGSRKGCALTSALKTGAQPRRVHFSCTFCGAREDLILPDKPRRVLCYCPFCGMRA